MKNEKSFQLNEDMAYFMGALVGDGHISNSTKSKTDLSKDYRINFELTTYQLIKEIEKITKQFIQTKSTSKKTKKRQGKKQSWRFQFRNKKFHTYLTEYIGLPKGSKTARLKVPNHINKSSDSIKKHFIAGLFDTDVKQLGLQWKIRDYRWVLVFYYLISKSNM